MTVDLDTVIRAIDPGALVIKLDGKDYPVREITLADFLQFERIAAMPAAEAITFLRGFFVGEPPPFLQQLQEVEDRMAKARAIRKPPEKEIESMLVERGPLVKRYTLVLSTMTAHFSEGNDSKNYAPAAATLIRRQIEEARSEASPE